MDNITHSLIGVLLGRALAPYVAPGRFGVRSAVIAAVIGSNLPDIDLVWMGAFADRQLGYLLHHRGHTHTLILAPVMAAAAGWLLERWLRRGQGAAEAAGLSRAGLWGVMLAGIALHILADSWNNYGVHPFWPFDNRWYYGDTIFIVEPWLWSVLGAYAFESARGGWRSGWRWLLGLGAAGTVGLIGWRLGPELASAWSVVTLVLAMVGSGMAKAKLPGWHMGATAGLTAAVWFVFALGSAQARAAMEAELARQVPEERVVDVVRAPWPGVPWCWWVIAVTEAPGGVHTLRSGIWSAWPETTKPERCLLWAPGERTIRLRPVEFSPDPHWRWEGEWARPSAELRAAASGEAGCGVRAFLGFGRAVWWEDRREAGAGERWWLGDLRYDFQPGAGFAEAEVSAETPCMTLPGWAER